MFAGGKRDIACCAAYRRSVPRRGSAAGGLGVFSRLAGNGSGFSIHSAREHRGERAREHRIPGYRGDRELFDQFFHSVVCGMCTAAHVTEPYSFTTSVMVKPRDAFCTKPCTVSGNVPVGVKGITFAAEL